MSQNVWLTTWPFLPGAALSKAGGRSASFQDFPASVERKSVGPRWPVRGGRQHRVAIPRIQYGVIDDMTQKNGFTKLPAGSLRIRLDKEYAFTRRNDDRSARSQFDPRLAHLYSRFPWWEPASLRGSTEQCKVGPDGRIFFATRTTNFAVIGIPSIAQSRRWTSGAFLN